MEIDINVGQCFLGGRGLNREEGGWKKIMVLDHLLTWKTVGQ